VTAVFGIIHMLLLVALTQNALVISRLLQEKISQRLFVIG